LPSTMLFSPGLWTFLSIHKQAFCASSESSTAKRMFLGFAIGGHGSVLCAVVQAARVMHAASAGCGKLKRTN
jgi:hypothetical protein